MDVNLIISIIILFLSLISITILLIKEENLIRNTYRKIKTLLTIYLLWSKKDRIKAKEIREKYQLPKDVWIKDETKITFTKAKEWKVIRR